KFHILGLGCVAVFALSAPAWAQNYGIREEPIPESRPAVVAPAPAVPTEAAAVAPAPKPHATFPYTIRPGDSLGAIAATFGVTAEDLARANHMHPDDELEAGDTLRVPNPFIAQVNGLQAQVDTLNAQLQSSDQKASSAQTQVRTLQEKADDLSAENQSLNSSLHILPWWRALALSAAAIAALMFGVMVVTLFEWWRMRRRFVALAGMTDSLGRLDLKYKEMLAKAELRLQQLYGRRRQGLAEGQPRPKLPEEMEIERLNEELKAVLEAHLERLGGRVRGARKRARWRELLGGVSSSEPAEMRSARR
ncbi:MAG TPA: LysM peptidoglycan-binding domain-containing protein, partial [Candidatus Binataceae bacterium]|nr:LysM peptidoglycan-binding domain-containing protein [Candidatus Binataceae bacterium]